MPKQPRRIQSQIHTLKDWLVRFFTGRHYNPYPDPGSQARVTAKIIPFPSAQKEVSHKPHTLSPSFNA